ncbi:hypothetical protein Acr_11g0014340 [Actinidia rufa]|uniref:Uncharacterized protein n=1 Tax=Actinidia rufa TaxID=165716 RepID=A0A7J0FEN0_9ERIC|nr:hypothetical protein Acr_11g0014340 [Actinidia rufa]
MNRLEASRLAENPTSGFGGTHQLRNLALISSSLPGVLHRCRVALSGSFSRNDNLVKLKCCTGREMLRHALDRTRVATASVAGRKERMC